MKEKAQIQAFTIITDLKTDIPLLLEQFSSKSSPKMLPTRERLSLVREPFWINQRNEFLGSGAELLASLIWLSHDADEAVEEAGW